MVVVGGWWRIGGFGGGVTALSRWGGPGNAQDGRQVDSRPGNRNIPRILFYFILFDFVLLFPPNTMPTVRLPPKGARPFKKPSKGLKRKREDEELAALEKQVAEFVSRPVPLSISIKSLPIPTNPFKSLSIHS